MGAWPAGRTRARAPTGRRGNVRFPRAEFQRVAYAAELAGLKLTEFMRKAALTSASQYPPPPGRPPPDAED